MVRAQGYVRPTTMNRTFTFQPFCCVIKRSSVGTTTTVGSLEVLEGSDSHVDTLHADTYNECGAN